MNLKSTGPNFLPIECMCDSPELVPAYAHAAEDAGCDLRANISQPATIEPGRIMWIPTGLHVAIPEGVFALQCPRSGLACNHGITLANAPGVIDPGYRGEVKCAMLNVGCLDYTIKPLERVAQLVFLPFINGVLTLVDELPPSSRGTDGYGSTGCM